MHSSSETRLSLSPSAAQVSGRQPAPHVTHARAPTICRPECPARAPHCARRCISLSQPCIPNLNRESSTHAFYTHHKQCSMLHLPPPSIKTPSFSSSCTMHKTDIGIVLLCSSTPHDTECVNSSCPNVVRNPPQEGESRGDKKPPSSLLELPPPAELKKLCAALGEGGNVRAAKSKARPVPVPVVV